MTAAESTAVAVGPLRAVLVILLLTVGSFFLVVGTVGLLRLPSVYNRMHATSKATTLGTGLIGLAGFVQLAEGHVVTDLCVLRPEPLHFRVPVPVVFTQNPPILPRFGRPRSLREASARPR